MASALGYAHSTVMTAAAVDVQIELPHGLARPHLGGSADLASIDDVDRDLDIDPDIDLDDPDLDP